MNQSGTVTEENDETETGPTPPIHEALDEGPDSRQEEEEEAENENIHINKFLPFITNNKDQIWNRQRAIAIFKDYNNAREKKNFPHELQAKDGYIYVFEGEGRERSNVITLDGKKWKSDTKAHSNNNQTVTMYVHTGSDGRNQPVPSRKRRIFYDTKKGQYLVAYLDKSEQVQIEENSITTAENEAQENQPVTTPSKKAQPIAVKMSKLDPEELHAMFETAKSQENVLTQNRNKSIENPEPGQVLLFDIQNMGKDWDKRLGKDSYQWKRLNNVLTIKVSGAKYFLTTSKVLTYIASERKKITSSNFYRHEYEDTNKMVGIFHYLGCKKNIIRGPHGNSQSDQPFIPTDPSVTTRISNHGLNLTPQNLMERENSTLLQGTLSATHSIRDTNQVKYIQRKFRDKVRLSTNVIESMLAVQNETGNFVRDLRLQPLLCSMMCDEMRDEFRKILSEMPIEEAIEVYKDTVFGMGPFFATTFSFKHPLLERINMSTNQKFPEPVIPLGFEIHERKLLKDHKLFLYNIAEAVDEGTNKDNLNTFKNKHMISITDAEFADLELWAFAKPNTNSIKIAPCWNHIRQNVEFKMAAGNFGDAEKKTVDKDIIYLLESETKEQYELRKQRLRDNNAILMTDKFLTDYFEKTMDDRIKKAASFYLKDIGFQHWSLGSTSNAAESFNQTLKRQAEYKEHTVGEQMLLFFYNQRVLALECEMALYGSGPFKLKENYNYMRKPLEEFPGSEIQTVESMSQKIRDALHVTTNELLVSDIDSPPMPKPTVEHIAEQIYNQNDIHFLTQDNKIIVKGLTEIKYQVDIGQMSCTCYQTKDCAHIRAVLRKLNLAKDFGDPKRIQKGYRTPTKKSIRRNFRDRKAGTKKPRIVDHLPVGSRIRPGIQLALSFEEATPTPTIEHNPHPVPTIDNEQSTETDSIPQEDENNTENNDAEMEDFQQREDTNAPTNGTFSKWQMNQIIEIIPKEVSIVQTDTLSPPTILSVQVNEQNSPLNIGEVVFDSQIDQINVSTPQDVQQSVPKPKKHVHFDITKNLTASFSSNDSTTDSFELPANITLDELHYTNNETLRKKPWSEVSQEEKEFFAKKMDKSAAHSISIDRHPNILQLGVDNEILGEIPLLQDDNEMITIQDKNNKQCVLLKLYNNMGIILVNEVIVANDTMFQTCGKIMANGYLPLENKKSFSIGLQVETDDDLLIKALQISEAQINFEERVRQKSTKKGEPPGKSPISDLKLKLFAIYCHCNEARFAKEKSNDLISCSKCQQKYHKICVNNNSTSFVCNSCSMKTTGLKWSATPKLVTNTCHFDNQLTHFAFRCEKSPKFKSEITILQGHTTLVKQAFAHATLNVLDNKSSAAQQCWANAIMLKKRIENLITNTPYPKPIDMLGGTDEFYEPLQDFGEFVVEDLVKCSQCNTQTKHKKNEIYITLTTDPLKNFLDSQVFKNVKTTCRMDGCQGELIQTKLKIPKDVPAPLWLIVKNSGSLQGPEAFLDFPKYLGIGAERFQLGVIVLFDELRTHFTSLHNIAESWMFYDGLLSNKKPRTALHRIVSKGDYIASHTTVDHLLYVRCIEGEEI